MQDLDAKERILQEIMDLADEKEGEHLKSHPKLMAKMQMEKPAAEEMPMGEEGGEGIEMAVKSEEELTPEMIKKLLEMAEEL